MTATPTPGDLSARHVEVLQRLLDCHGNHTVIDDDDASALTAAIAALSALPAAGGAKPRPVAWYVFAGTEHWVTHDEDEAEGNRAGGCEVRPLIFGDTTPQPSAAEVFTEKHGVDLRGIKVGEVLTAEQWEAVCAFVREQDTIIDAREDADVVEWDGATRTMQEHLYLMTGERDRYKALHEQSAPTIARMERRIAELDAAVGAQGDGVPPLVAEALEYFGRVDDPAVRIYTSAINRFIRRLAAPAAGKGVDDLLDLATLYGDHSVDSRNRESWDFDAHGLKQLAAALTRQPVAGDGIRAATPEEEAAIDAALGYTKLTIRLPRDLLAAVGEAAAREGLVRVAMIRALIKRGLSSENTPAEPAQTAPAATPTDGGEGS